MGGNEATQQGVSKRDRDMEAIVEKREAEAKELEEFEDLDDGLEDDDLDDSDDADDDVDDSDDDLDDPEPTVSFLGSDGTEYKVPMSATAKIKIDGEEIEAPVSKVTSQYQKGAAGEIRLQEASNLKKELELKAAKLTAQEEEFVARMNAADEQKATGDLSEDDYADKVRELIDAVVEADADRAVELFSTVYQRPQAENPVDVDKVVDAKVDAAIESREVKREATARKNKIDAANVRFEKEYKELFDDPMLYNLVNTETIKISNESPGLEPWDIISKAAEAVNEWRGKFKIKKSKKKTPTPAGGRASIGEDKKPTPTRKTILNDMREARGQPVL